MRKRKSDFKVENVISLGFVSLITAIGFIFCGMFFLNIDAKTVEPLLIMASTGGISAILWLLLLYRNC